MPPSTLLAANEAGVLTLAEATQISASGVVSRTVLNTPEIRVVFFTFADGQELTQHTSRRRAIVHIVDGACDFLFAGQWHRLEAGTLLHLPPQHPHAVRATAGPFSMLLTLSVEAAESISSH